MSSVLQFIAAFLSALRLALKYRTSIAKARELDAKIQKEADEKKKQIEAEASGQTPKEIIEDFIENG